MVLYGQAKREIFLEEEKLLFEIKLLPFELVGESSAIDIVVTLVDELNKNKNIKI